MQYYRPMTARVTMEPTRPDLTIVGPEPTNETDELVSETGEPVSEDAADQGLRLFRSGRMSEAMPFLERGARERDPRAQYVYATALFNGDAVPCDVPRAFDLMQQASDAGLPQAAESLVQMQAIARSTIDSSTQASAEPSTEEEALMSDAALARCRSTLSEMSKRTAMPDHAPPSLAAMTQALLAIELRKRLETLLPDTIERAVRAAQMRAVAERS